MLKLARGMDAKKGVCSAVVLIAVSMVCSVCHGASELPCGNKMRVTGNSNASPAAVPRVVLVNNGPAGALVSEADKSQPRPKLDYGDPVFPYTGNEFKEIQDLQIWGAVGDEAMVWTRYANSRSVAGANLFGLGHYWRHGYQWELSELRRDEQMRPQMRLVYPDGTAVLFTAIEPGRWGSLGVLTDQLTQDGDDFVLVRKNGSRYRFVKNEFGAAGKLRLHEFFDAFGNAFSIQYNGSGEVVKVVEPAGRNFVVNYATVSGNQSNIQLLASLDRPPARGEWVEFAVGVQQPFRFVRVVQADGSFGQIAEVEFYHAISGERLEGTLISSDQNAARRATDLNNETVFESASESGGYVGYDFGQPRLIGRVRVLSAAGMESVHLAKAINAQSLRVEGMNERPVSMRVIAGVRTSDGRSVQYHYTPFVDASLPWSFPVLSGVQYGDGTRATYGYAQVVPSTRPLVTDWSDVRYGLRQSRYRTVYQTRLTGTVLGMVQSQVNIETGGEILKIGVHSGKAHEPTVTFANGAVCRQFFSESADGRRAVQTETDARGGRTFFAIGADGYLASVKDPIGRVTRFLWTSSGNLRAVTRPDGSVESWERNESGALIQHTDALRRSTSFLRDALNRVTKIVYPDGGSEEFEYNHFGQVVLHRNQRGGVETREYDLRGLLLRVCNAAGQCTWFEYDAADRLCSVTDAAGRVTRMEYDERGLMVKKINPDGSARLMKFSKEGDLVEEQDEMGQVWGYQYDVFRRMVSVVDPLGNTMRKKYHPDCTELHPLEIISAGNAALRYDYDLAWNLVASRMSASGDGGVSRFKYDKVDRLISTTDPLGYTKVYSYDSSDRCVRVQDAGGVCSASKYDEVGNLLWTQHRGGARTSFEYDSMNRLVCSINPNGHAVRFEYDLGGNRISMLDPRNAKYAWSYDSIGRLSSALYPDGSVERWSYDSAGNSMQFVNRAGQSCSSSFDSRGLELERRWSDGTQGVTRRFDLRGRVVFESNGLCTIHSEYDALGRLIHESTELKGSEIKRISMTHDADGRVVRVKYPGGGLVENQYGEFGRLERVLQNGSVVGDFSYDLNGQLSGLKYGNGSISSFRRDVLGRVTNVSHWFGAGQTLSIGYQFNRSGLRALRSQTGILEVEEAYGYDRDNQLISIWSGSQRPTLYAYDQAGNRSLEESVGGQRVYSSNLLNQITTAGSDVITYDSCGNMRQSGIARYTYDAENRLISAEVNGRVTSFEYDPRGRVCRRVVDGEACQMFYSGWNILEEWKDGSRVAEYVYGAGADEVLKFVSPLGEFFSHADALSSTVALSDAYARPVECYTYSPFGAPGIINADGSTRSHSAVGNRFLFTGAQWNWEAAVYDLRNRVYSPDLGRFLQPDPLQFGGGDENLYRYVKNSPLNFSDPFGLYAIVRDSCGDVSVTLPITFVGPGATPAVVEKFSQGIEKHWSGTFGQYRVGTKVTVADKNTPGNRKNVIYVTQGDGRAYVRAPGLNTGIWPADRPGWTAAHEAGHLMGLPDRYTDKVGPHPGYEHNIMGVHGGVATAEDIQQIIKLNP
jgi:RHS repeat-associated protein